MVLPNQISKQILGLSTDIYPSGLIQRALHLYLQSGHLSDQVEKIRKLINKRYDFFLKQVDECLYSHVKYCKPDGGLAVWLQLRDEKLSAEEICQKLIKRNVIITPGSMFALDGRDLPNLRLSIADIKEKDIQNGIKILSKVLKNGV